MTDIPAILRSARTIAMIGASSNPDRPSHPIMKMLMDSGYTVIPINPNEDAVHGQKAYPSLADLPADARTSIDIVNVFRRPAQTPDVARQAVDIGAKTLWLQLGITNGEAADIARAGGLNYIEDTCIAVELRLMR